MISKDNLVQTLFNYNTLRVTQYTMQTSGNSNYSGVQYFSMAT